MVTVIGTMTIRLVGLLVSRVQSRRSVTGT